MNKKGAMPRNVGKRHAERMHRTVVERILAGHTSDPVGSE